MFDKLKFNNMIISGKKEIQRAKVQVVRKVIQKIQKLKKTLERRPEDENCKIKLRKCMAVVESAKKLKHFDIVISTLLLEKSPNKVITNSQSTPEQISVAMLANNTIMKALSARISNELNFSEADWRKAIIGVSKQKIKKQRKKKRKQMLEAETPTIKTPKKTKKIKSNISSNLEEVSENISEDIVSNQIIDNNVMSIEPKASRKKQMVKDKASSIQKTIKTKNIKSDDIPSNIEKITEKNSEEIVSNKIIDSNFKSKKPKASKEMLSILKNNVDKKTDDINENFEDKELKADTFLMASSKSNQQKSAKTNDKEARKFDNYNNELTDSRENIIFPKNKTTFVEKEVKLAKVVDPFFVTATGEHYVTIAPVIEDNASVENKFDFKATIKDQDHNTWEAKQKQQNNKSFQCKRKNVRDTNDKEKAKHQAASDLHPSWAAKQKLKPTITTFQGKKIKFEED